MEPIDPTVSSEIDVLAVADHIIRRDAARPEPDVTPLKLAKILYLAQANYLASTGRRMFDEPIEAFDNGPVVYREWVRHPGRQIIATRDDAAPVRERPLPDDVSEFLDRVWAKYKDWSASQLWALTHEQAPWRDHYRPDGYRVRIPDQDMASYFRENVATDDRIFHPDVVILPDDFLDDADADAFAAKYEEFMRR